MRQFLDTLVQNWRATRSVDNRLRQPAGGDSPWWPMPPWSKWFSMCWTMPGCIAALGALAGAVRCRCVANRGHRPGPRLFGRRAATSYALPVHQRGGRGGLGLFLSMNVARTLGGSVVYTQPPRRRRRSHHHAFAGCHHPARHRLRKTMDTDRLLLIVEDDEAFAQHAGAPRSSGAGIRCCTPRASPAWKNCWPCTRRSTRW